MNTCVGCLPGVRLPPVLAARQKSPPETAAEGKFLTASNHGREGGVVMVGYNESALKVVVQNIVRVYKPKERCFRECALAAAGSLPGDKIPPYR